MLKTAQYSTSASTIMVLKELLHTRDKTRCCANISDEEPKEAFLAQTSRTSKCKEVLAACILVFILQ